ncbi:hypothetical protein M9H77_08118 [Catharanthus roseus]|uniref:Uncharacterized protein n=1 Tax=Catharanthus roseus TaxID=4058 RepID=A0ACC0BWV1_CATRO|nr:hypothetical protein M9H77_08118 [Catharanthus roseus]
MEWKWRARATLLFFWRCFSLIGIIGEGHFGLNALYGRTIGSYGSTMGPWNSSNAESLIRYTVWKNYTIYDLELGNHLHLMEVLQHYFPKLCVYYFENFRN